MMLKELALRGLIVGPKESEEAFFLRVSRAQKKETVDLSLPYGIKPDWIEWEETKKGLSWFQGAATWVEEDRVKIQLKKNRWASLEEMVRHEAVHAVRSQFDEPLFEEFFAYATSGRSYRRKIGPLFRSTQGTMGLLLSCVAGVFMPWVPYVVMGGYGLSLMLYHRKFQRALKKIKEVYPAPMELALHLTDAEIVHFSKELIKEDSLRWRQIRARFSLTMG